MEPIFIEITKMENYQYGTFNTYEDQMSYFYDDSTHYSTAQPFAESGYEYYQHQNVADQPMYPGTNEQNAGILLAIDQQSGNDYQSLFSGTQFDDENNISVLSVKDEAELLDYLNSFGDLTNIQILPIADMVENTENDRDQTSDQEATADHAERLTIDTTELELMLSDQTKLPVKQTTSTKTTDLKATKYPRPWCQYQNSSFACEPCGRTFGRRSSLRQHNNVHHSGPREHRCETCGKRFHTVDDLRKHVKRHMAQNKPFKCPECPRQFNYHQDLVRHTAVQHGVAKYECKQCGKRIARRDHLLLHEATHAKRLTRKQRRNRFQELVQQQQ